MSTHPLHKKRFPRQLRGKASTLLYRQAVTLGLFGVRTASLPPGAQTLGATIGILARRTHLSLRSRHKTPPWRGKPLPEDARKVLIAFRWSLFAPPSAHLLARRFAAVPTRARAGWRFVAASRTGA